MKLSMDEAVIDASTLLAFVLEEPLTVADSLLERAVISTVNLAEVKTKLVDVARLDLDAIHDDLLTLIRIVDFTEEHATLAASLRRSTRHLGLSLGDRACLALGISLGAEVYTAVGSASGLVARFTLYVRPRLDRRGIDAANHLWR